MLNYRVLDKKLRRKGKGIPAQMWKLFLIIVCHCLHLSRGLVTGQRRSFSVRLFTWYMHEYCKNLVGSRWHSMVANWASETNDKKPSDSLLSDNFWRDVLFTMNRENAAWENFRGLNSTEYRFREWRFQETFTARGKIDVSANTDRFNWFKCVIFYPQRLLLLLGWDFTTKKKLRHEKNILDFKNQMLSKQKAIVGTIDWFLERIRLDLEKCVGHDGWEKVFNKLWETNIKKDCICTAKILD